MSQLARVGTTTTTRATRTASTPPPPPTAAITVPQIPSPPPVPIAVELHNGPDRGDDCCCFSRKNGPPGTVMVAIFVLVVVVQLPLFVLSCLSVHYLHEQTSAVNAKRGDQTIYAPFFYKASPSDSTNRNDYAFFIPAGGEPLWRHCGVAVVPFRCPDQLGGSSIDYPGDCKRSNSDPDKTVKLFWSNCEANDFTKSYPDNRAIQLKSSMQTFSSGLFAASVVGIVAPAITFLMMCFVACASHSCACVFGGDLRRLVRPILTVVCAPASVVGLVCSALAVAMVSEIWTNLRTIFGIPTKQDAPLPPNGIDNFESAAIGLLVCNCLAFVMCLVAVIMVCTEEPATGTQHGHEHDHDEGSEMHSLPPILDGQVQTSQPEPANGVPFAHHISTMSWPTGYTGGRRPACIIHSSRNRSNRTEQQQEDDSAMHTTHSAAFPSS